MQKKELRTD